MTPILPDPDFFHAAHSNKTLNIYIVRTSGNILISQQELFLRKCQILALVLQLLNFSVQSFVHCEHSLISMGFKLSWKYSVTSECQ